MDESRRCQAMLSDGSRRCRKAAILGSNVCASHGAGAPQVKQAAHQRLQELVEPSIAGLRKALELGNVRELIRAARVVLDRTGHGPSSRLVLERFREQERPWLFDLLDRLELTDEQREMLGTIVGQVD